MENKRILTVGRVDSQIDGYVGDAFIAAGYAIRFPLDLLPHLVEVHELLSLAVQKLGELCNRKTPQKPMKNSDYIYIHTYTKIYNKTTLTPRDGKLVPSESRMRAPAATRLASAFNNLFFFSLHRAFVAYKYMHIYVYAQVQRRMSLRDGGVVVADGNELDFLLIVYTRTRI